MQRIKLFVFLIVFVMLTSNMLHADEKRGVKRVVIKSESGQNIGLYKESHALVIGVSDYNNGWPKLPGVLKDVQAVSKALRENGFHVETVTDPDSGELNLAFKRFISRYGRKTENRLLFYFAGHGHTITPKWGGRAMGYIVPTDAPNPHNDESRFKDSALPMQRIEEYALGIDSKHALFLFDSCFSGSLFAVTRAIPESISYKTVRPVRQFITAGSAEETVPDVSAFRQQFVSALEGEGDVNEDGFLTGTELGEFLQNKVVNYSKGAQHPQYGKIRNPHLDKGDFVFKMPGRFETPAPVLHSPPSTSEFSLEDLDEQAVKEEALKQAWEKKMQQMKSAFGQVASYEKRDISTDLKIKAWERFQKAFPDNNPYSQEDDDFRKKSEKRVIHWKQTKIFTTYLDEQDREDEEERPASGIDKLNGVKIWVKVKDLKSREKYCSKFSQAGLIVECEDNPTVDENEMFLKCSELPDGAGRIIQDFLGRDDIRIYDWRTNPDYANYCDEFDAISFEVFR